MKNYVEIGKKGVNDHTENTRLEIQLSKSDSTFYKSVNYRKIVALKKGYSNIDSLEFEDPHDRFKDYEEESYIDNSELLRDTYPPGQEPENVGFFINFGKLKLKPQSSKSAGCSPKTLSSKKKKHHGDRERKRNKSGTRLSKPNRSLDTSPTHVRLDSEVVPKISITVSSPVVVSEPKKVFKSESKHHHHHHHRDKSEKKKLKLILKEEKKARKSIDGVKSPKSKKKVDANVVLDKILMSRAKDVKNCEGKILPSSANYIMLPSFDGGMFPYYSIKP